MITSKDVNVVGYTLGRVINNIGLLLLFPVPLAVLYTEWSVIPDFVMAASVAFILSSILRLLFYTKDELKFRHAMVVSTLVYAVAAVVAGLPLWTSGSVNTILDATFEGMSGWTGTGLSMVPDMDHLSHAINFWRHFIQFIGGAGIVVFGLALLNKGISGSTRLYVSEGREEKLFPSIAKTSQVILGMCLFFLLVCSTLLSLAGWHEGMSLGDAVFDGVSITMTAFGTGGFAPHPQSINYYHSILYEIVVLIICVIGSISFVVHFTVLTGNRGELRRNIEIITFSTTVILLSVIVMSFLLYFNTYSSPVELFRRGVFQLISGHTGAGLQNINPTQLSNEWPFLSLFAVTVAMLLGGASCSTSAGIKSIRVAVIAKIFMQEVKRIIFPENAVVVAKFHHIRQNIISDRTARGALMVAAAYIMLFMFGSLITTFYGYSMINSMFETASALGNTGLSVGVATYQSPPVIKMTYIFLMWAGRLEIIALFVLIGIIYLGIRRATYISAEVYRSGEKVADKVLRHEKGLRSK